MGIPRDATVHTHVHTSHMCAHPIFLILTDCKIHNGVNNSLGKLGAKVLAMEHPGSSSGRKERQDTEWSPERANYPSGGGDLINQDVYGNCYNEYDYYGASFSYRGTRGRRQGQRRQSL